MKKILVSFLSCSLFAAMHLSGSFGGTTIENLKEAYKFEMTASAKYVAFAEQAKKEKLDQIVVLFNAMAKSQAIHAANHKTVLERMGAEADEFKPEFVVRTTKENLASASQEELKEINDFYTANLAAAKSENAMDAAKSMRWAMETERKHLAMYKNALDALNANKVANLPAVYFVCPKCGNTYDVPTPEAECGFCGTKSAKFIRFDK